MSVASRPVLVVSGLAAEARIAAGPDVVGVAAPPAALRQALEKLTVEPAAVVSFGLCGGLAPDLRAGALVVGTAVAYRNETWVCAPVFASRMAGDADIEIAEGPVACADAPVLTAGEKGVLRAETGAIAVDTESHIAAAFAAGRGLPFAVLRVVCDTAANDLPPLAVRAIGPDGHLDWRAIGGELTARPNQLLDLPGTALATVRAMRTLRRVRRRLGSRLGF